MSVSMMATPAIAATPAIIPAPTIAAHPSRSFEGIVPSLPAIAVYPEIPVTPPVASPLTVAVHPTAPVVPVEVPSPGALEKKSEPSRFSQLLAEKNNNYYQTFNNQRTQSTNIAQPPMVVPDRRPLEVKLHLDGREIHRAVIEQERGQEVRSNG